MNPRPVRVAIYPRVSKDDGSQGTDNQLLKLREFCERWEVHGLVAEYVDRESGTRGRRERRDFDRVFADAARRRFDVLLFWALDRFSREGIRKDHRLPRAPRPLRGCVQVLRGALPRHRQRADSPHRVLGVTSHYAQQEASRISDRTNVGLERARRSGKVLGRPDGFERWAPVLAGMKRKYWSQGRINRETGLSYNSAKKHLRRLEEMRA